MSDKLLYPGPQLSNEDDEVDSAESDCSLSKSSGTRRKRRPKSSKKSKRLMTQKQGAGSVSLSAEPLKASRKFSKKETTNVLETLKKHGVDYVRLQKALPTRSIGEIAQFLSYKAKEGVEMRGKRKFVSKLKTLQSLENWASALIQTQSPFIMEELSLALNAIVKYEKHPPPELCGGIDFKKMYEYLALVISGQPPCHMPPENLALLSASLDMVRHHTTELPFTCALNKQIAELKSIDLRDAQAAKPKTYSKKDLQERNVADARINPLNINEDLLALNKEDVISLPLKNELIEKIPVSSKLATLFFQDDGSPLERSLVFNALRLEERPVTTIYRCTGQDVFIHLPYLTSKDLEEVHFSSIAAYPKPLAVLSIEKVIEEDNVLVTSIVPGCNVLDKASQPDSKTHVISIETMRGLKSKPFFVHQLPEIPSTTDIQYFPKLVSSVKQESCMKSYYSSEDESVHELYEDEPTYEVEEVESANECDY